jgi:hypothetical protein
MKIEDYLNISRSYIVLSICAPTLRNVERLHAYKWPAADEIPLSIAENVKLENSIHNFYKAIKGMCGGHYQKMIIKLSVYSHDM